MIHNNQRSGENGTILAFGDSISDPTWDATMWPSWYTMYKPGAQVIYGGIAGVTAQTSAGIRLTGGGLGWWSWVAGGSGPVTTVQGGGKVAVLLGINDIIFTVGLTAGTLYGYLSSIYSYIAGLGLTPIPITILPGGAATSLPSQSGANWNAAAESIRTTVNTSILGSGYHVVDGSAALGDSSNPQQYQPAFGQGAGSGNVHPNVNGSRYLASLVALR